MEDRISAGVYCEFSDLFPIAYRQERSPTVLARPGVHEARMWVNTAPQRDDLPRRLPEAGLLATFEVDAEFRPPSVVDGVRGHHFVRTPRPGQGRLTGRPTLGLLIVMISPNDPDAAQELRDWGDFVHLRHIAATGVPGYTMMTPYESARHDEPRFLHLYEMDTSDPEAAYATMTPLVADRLGGPDSDRFREWAWHPQLRIEYVNTFALVEG
ncbi:MAG TPA: hypothetical protein VJM33_02275 [Microthrixaceae bacterium]|nr:hypothetical protein [Microthrixaceae bacterium]